MSTAEPIIINDVLREKASNGLAYYNSDGDSTARSTAPPVQHPKPHTHMVQKSPAPRPPPRQSHSPQLSPVQGYHHHIEPVYHPPPSRDLTPEEDALRGFDEILGVPLPPPAPSSDLSFSNLLLHSSETNMRYDPSLPSVEEPQYRETLDLPPPPQFAGSRDNSPNRELTSLQVQPVMSLQSSPDLSSYDERPQDTYDGIQSRPQAEVNHYDHHQHNGGHYNHNGTVVSDQTGHPTAEVNGIPVAKLPSGAGYGSLRERVKSRRSDLEFKENTYLLPKPAKESAVQQQPTRRQHQHVQPRNAQQRNTQEILQQVCT